MAAAAKAITNGKTLDKLINETLATMRSNGTTRNVRKTVGGDPSGLIIQITPAGSATWLMRITAGGKRREIGLGSYRRANAVAGETGNVSLTKARIKADKIADAVQAGRDPMAERLAGREKKETFREVALNYIDRQKSGWSNPKHAKQWTSTLEKWVFPIIGDDRVESIDLDAVERILVQLVPGVGKPLWIARHVTATRVRQRIEHTLDYAAAKGLRESENPARLIGRLAKVLPALSKKDRKVKNHPSLPYGDVPSFVAELTGRAGIAARALQFLIYTAARSGEVRMADWSEIDLVGRLWNLPEERMKAGEPHTVPLSAPAVAILESIPMQERNGLVFPGSKPDAPMSDMTLASVLKRMKRRDITVHGFRATFRTWAEEQTSYPRDVKELALAHTIGESETERAYLRTKHLPQRTQLMSDWANYFSDT